MPPDEAPAPETRAQFSIRYDDLTQHAHVKLATLQLALGRACFDDLWAKHPLFETRKQGIAPILSRLVLEGEPVAVSYGAPLEAQGRIDLAHEPDATGGVSALIMNASAEIWALPSRRDPAVDPSTRQPVRIGRAYGEHVMTKPYGPPSERKVLAFDVPGQPPVPSSVHHRIRVVENASLPEGAEALDTAPSPDDAPWTFGLFHTDLNQHVNSLVYARMFEEAALRRIAKHRLDHKLIAKRISLCYRKPSFAGESLVCTLQSFVLDNAGERTVGAVGYL
ncbi:MAG: hypothetical protein ABW321_32810, partial [Polyangiales bacterium]